MEHTRTNSIALLALTWISTQCCQLSIGNGFARTDGILKLVPYRDAWLGCQKGIHGAGHIVLVLLQLKSGYVSSTHIKDSCWDIMSTCIAKALLRKWGKVAHVWFSTNRDMYLLIENIRVCSYEASWNHNKNDRINLLITKSIRIYYHSACSIYLAL